MQKERRDALRALLAEKTFVSLDELHEMFPSVSEMTLRRDIEYFESQGLALKVRGGCKRAAAGSLGEYGADARMLRNIEAKQKIARSALDCLETGRSIFIDSGSTMKSFAQLVPPKRYSFITTDPEIALKLCRNSRCAVNIVGGRLEGENRTVTGLQATRFLSDINIDIAFLTPAAYSSSSGFTVANYNECELKRIVVEKARRVIMLMDSSKCDRTLPYTFCEMADADMLITESASRQLIDEACGADVRLVLAE